MQGEVISPCLVTLAHNVINQFTTAPFGGNYQPARRSLLRRSAPHDLVELPPSRSSLRRPRNRLSSPPSSPLHLRRLFELCVSGRGRDRRELGPRGSPSHSRQPRDSVGCHAGRDPPRCAFRGRAKAKSQSFQSLGDGVSHGLHASVELGVFRPGAFLGRAGVASPDDVGLLLRGWHLLSRSLFNFPDAFLC